MPKRKTAKKRVTKKPKSRLLFGYPLVVLLMLCVGTYLTNVTFAARADQITVNASVQGPPVTTAATITSPTDGTHFIAVPIQVTGTCAAEAAYVEIFRNNLMSGSAICNSGQFSIQIDLFAGKNILTAHSFNPNDNEGPVSSPVTVYYDVPIPQPTVSTPTPATSTPSAKVTIPPLSLKTAFVYKGYYVNQEVAWPLEISGGVAPYAFNVDWGDGSINSVISRSSEGPFNIKHTYKKSGGYKGSYTIKVQASDSQNNYAYLEFFVIVNTNKTTATIGNIYSKPPPTIGNLRTWLWVAWPVYSVMFLMIITYKLGEREELILLRKRGRLRHT